MTVSRFNAAGLILGLGGSFISLGILLPSSITVATQTVIALTGLLYEMLAWLVTIMVTGSRLPADKQS